VTDERRSPPADVRWVIHDGAVGALAGFTVGYAVGIFALRLIDHPVVPFVVAAIGAVIGVRWLLSVTDETTGITMRRVIAWVLLVLATTFLVLLFVAIANFE